MGELDGEFLAELYRRWHGYAPPAADAAGLARFLGPTDAAARQAAAGVGFDDEPSDYDAVLARLAEGGWRP